MRIKDIIKKTFKSKIVKKNSKSHLNEKNLKFVKDKSIKKKVLNHKDSKKPIKLRVAEALQDDAYKGIARIDSEVMKEIGIKRGDIVIIKGGRETIAIADKSYPADVREGIIRIDGIIRKNARTEVSKNVIVGKTEIKEATKIVIAPAQKGIRVQGDLKPGLLGRVVVEGDIIVLGGIQRRRDLMSDEFGNMDDIFGNLNEMFGGAGFGNLGDAIQQIRFVIVSTNPGKPCIITENTELVLNNKTDVNNNIFTSKDIKNIVENIKKNGARFLVLQDGCNNFIQIYMKYKDIEKEHFNNANSYTVYKLKPILLIKGAKLEHKKIIKKSVKKNQSTIKNNLAQKDNFPKYLILQNGCNNYISVVYSYEEAVKKVPNFNQTNTIYEMEPYSTIKIKPEVIKI